MRNIAVIFAGGVGSRMKNATKPKQFLEVDGIPIIIHTISKFQNCKSIDAISISCKEEYISLLEKLVIKFKLDKVRWIVRGGCTGQLSIYNALEAVYHSEEVDEKAIVLIHDGVRPVIDEELIIKNIQITQEKGNAITVCKAIETVFSSQDKVNIDSVLDREKIYYAKAPQTFLLKDLYQLHRKEMERGNVNNIDSCSMMHKEGINLNFVLGKSSNIKITTYEDYCMYKALYELENSVPEGDFIYE